MVPSVSILIAVYQAEKYLNICLNSILSQTFSDFEVILVDDGSKDLSRDICDEYAKKDSRVNVIRKQNGGVASARQCGIDNAQGEYIIYVDPDDWVESDMLEVMYHEAKSKDADMVFVDYYWENQTEVRYMNEKPKDLNHFTLLEAILNQSITGATWTKLIRRSLFKKYKVTFPPINMTEDTHAMSQLLLNDIKLVYIPKAFYHYVTYINPNSLLKNVKEYKERLEAFYQLLHDDYYKYWLVYLGYRWNWLSFDILANGKLSKKDYIKYFIGLRDVDKGVLCRNMNFRSKMNMEIVLFSLTHYKTGRFLAFISKKITEISK